MYRKYLLANEMGENKINIKMTEVRRFYQNINLRFSLKIEKHLIFALNDN